MSAGALGSVGRLPDYDWPCANLASLLIDQGDPDRGYDPAFAAARRNPHSVRNFFLGGKAQALSGRNLEALKWLQPSTDLDRGDSKPWYREVFAEVLEPSVPQSWGHALC